MKKQDNQKYCEFQDVCRYHDEDSCAFYATTCRIRNKQLALVQERDTQVIADLEVANMGDVGLLRLINQKDFRVDGVE